MSPLLMAAAILWPPSLPAFEYQFQHDVLTLELWVEIDYLPNDSDTMSLIGYGEGSIDALCSVESVGVHPFQLPWQPRLGLPWKISPENFQLYEDLSDSFCTPEAEAVLGDPLAAQYYSWYYAGAADACIGKTNPQPAPRGSVPQQNFIDSDVAQRLPRGAQMN